MSDDKIYALLNARNAYWDPNKPAIIEILQSAPEMVDRATLVSLVRELDRRFMQLWDKVTFEQLHGLVDYNKLK